MYLFANQCADVSESLDGRRPLIRTGTLTEEWTYRYFRAALAHTRQPHQTTHPNPNQPTNRPKT